MKQLLSIIAFLAVLSSCKKSSNDAQPDKVMNGVNVTVAVSSFNSFRTQGITGYPATTSVTWNDTLSNAAYNFAVAKSQDASSTNSYQLSNGQMIFSFPAALQYSRNTFYALHYAYPSTTDVKTVITAGFTSTDPTIKAGLMSASAKQFGMAQYANHWYLLMSN